MKKVRWTAWMLAAALLAGTALAGCGSQKETEEESASVEIIELVQDDDTVSEIGDPTASLKIQLTNEMGSAITGLSVKSPLETQYPANMMTSGQTIKNGESVDFYYEPVTARDLIPEGWQPVKPDAEDVGYWSAAGDAGCELTILEVTDDTVSFHLWWYPDTDTEESVAATFDEQNIGSFSAEVNDGNAISGTIEFYTDLFVVDIEQSEDQQIETGTMVFNGREEASLEEEPDASVTEDTCALQVTMENGDIYELIGFDVEDMAEVTLCLEDGVAFLEYMSLSENVLINTKEQELQIKADKDAAQAVIDMIAAIGEVTAENAEDHRSEIEAARAAYEALTDAQKAYVTNLNLLEEMESALGSRIEEQTEEESSDKVEYNGESAYSSGYELGRQGLAEDASEVIQMADYWNEVQVEYDYSGAGTEFWEGYYAGHNDYKDEEYVEKGFDTDDYDEEEYEEFFDDYYDTDNLGDINRERAHRAEENGEELDVGHWEGDEWVQNY